MEYDLILHALDPDGNMMTWKYPDIKTYLIHENHQHQKNHYKFYKAKVNGIELSYSDKWPLLMRDVGDFKTYCRRTLERKFIKTVISKEILRRFLLGENEEKKKRVYEAICNGEDIKGFYNNGGGGLCEYRPGYIAYYDFFNPRGITIKWNNEDLDIYEATVPRKLVLNEVKTLIAEGKYILGIKPKAMLDEEQLPGQMTIFDYM